MRKKGSGERILDNSNERKITYFPRNEIFKNKFRSNSIFEKRKKETNKKKEVNKHYLKKKKITNERTRSRNKKKRKCNFNASFEFL